MELNYGIPEGPYLEMAKQANDFGTKVFIFTTRSGLHAVGRMNAFLRDHLLRKHERHLKNVFFFVAREDFDREIVRLAKRFGSCQVEAYLASDALQSNRPRNVAITPVSPQPTNLPALSARVSNVIASADLRWRETSARRNELQLALEHGRQIFQYHANQRHTAMNYYFLILAALVTGFATLYSHDELWQPGRDGPTIGLWLGVAAILITLCFFFLEQRNRQLVDGDEKLLKRAERELAGLSGLAEFETVLHSDLVQKWWMTYRRLVGAVLLVFGLLWAGEIWVARHRHQPMSAIQE
jgi:hypothetical protein